MARLPHVRVHHQVWRVGFDNGGGGWFAYDVALNNGGESIKMEYIQWSN